MAKCPVGLYSYLDRRCVDKATCEGLDPRRSAGQTDSYKAFNGRCHYHCPDQYEEDPSNNKTCRFCGNDCIRKCQGNITIDSLSKVREFYLKKISFCLGPNTGKMYSNWWPFGNWNETRNGKCSRFGADEGIRTNSNYWWVGCQISSKISSRYLLIRLTPSFVNLYMFKNLQTITGRYLYRDKYCSLPDYNQSLLRYAISVYENSNLQKLFPGDRTFNVSAGFLQFQNNKMLCFDHITAFMKSLGRYKEMDEFDQSRNSNGDKAICKWLFW